MCNVFISSPEKKFKQTNLSLIGSNNMQYLIAFIGLLVLVAYLFFKKRYAYWKERGVPFPKPTWLFGNTGKCVMLNTMMSDICNNIYSDYKEYAYVGLFNFWSPAVVVRDIELIKKVLIKEFNNFHDNWLSISYSVDPVMAKNPFIMTGDEWKLVRTQITPQYTGAKLKGMIPIMQEVSKNMVKYVKEQTETKNSNTFEIKELIARFTGENVLTCAYGLEGKSFVDEVPVAFKIGEEIASPNLIVQIKQTIGMFFPRLRNLLKVTFLGCPTPQVFWDMILGTIKYREENNIVRKDYLDFIKELKKSKNSPYEVNDAYCVAHAFTFFLDSFETSATALTYVLYELALNPDIQTKGRAEVEKVLEKYNGSLSHEALLEMEYVDNIVSESLRKHPILLFLSRICTEECKFPPPGGSGKDIIIEKGTQIYLPVYGIHHDPQYYSDPERFDPDRFTEEVKSTRPKGTFLSFGDGPRICLGRNYAIIQIKVAMVAILSEFEVRMNSKTKVPYERDLLQLLNSVKDGIYLDFHKKT